MIAPPIRLTDPSRAGSMPRTVAPSMRSPCTSSACSSMKGEAPSTPGAAAARRASASPSKGAPAAGSRVACADRLSSRSRSSASKPFITDRIVISAVTPRATPPSDSQVISDTPVARERT